MNTKNKVSNAVKWIDDLLITKDKQAAGRLGNSESGFCCLGKACDILEIEYDPDDDFSDKLEPKIGLMCHQGTFYEDSFEKTKRVGSKQASSLADANDEGARFKSIAKFMIKNPELVFEKEVAEGIKKHYKTN